jgi:hypothetical protein
MEFGGEFADDVDVLTTGKSRPSSARCADRDLRKAHDFLRLLAEDMADQVVSVQALHAFL